MPARNQRKKDKQRNTRFHREVKERRKKPKTRSQAHTHNTTTNLSVVECCLLLSRRRSHSGTEADENIAGSPANTHKMRSHCTRPIPPGRLRRRQPSNEIT